MYAVISEIRHLDRVDEHGRRPIFWHAYYWEDKAAYDRGELWVMVNDFVYVGNFVRDEPLKDATNQRWVLTNGKTVDRYRLVDGEWLDVPPPADVARVTGLRAGIDGTIRETVQRCWDDGVKDRTLGDRTAPGGFNETRRDDDGILAVVAHLSDSTMEKVDDDPVAVVDAIRSADPGGLVRPR